MKSKRQLYETIMVNVAKEVKRALNEGTGTNFNEDDWGESDMRHWDIYNDFLGRHEKKVTKFALNKQPEYLVIEFNTDGNNTIYFETFDEMVQKDKDGYEFPCLPGDPNSNGLAIVKNMKEGSCINFCDPNDNTGENMIVIRLNK